jgi:hypothetical protein
MRDDLDRRLRDALDRVPAPDLWREASRPVRPTRIAQAGLSTAKRVITGGVALAIFAAAVSFIAIGRERLPAPVTTKEASSGPGGGPTSGSPSSVTGLVDAGRLRCEASFPSNVLTPGEPTGVRFEVTNVTGSPVNVRTGVNGDVGWLSFRRSDTLLAETFHVHDGIGGPFPGTENLAPGSIATIGAEDPPVRWGGTLTIVPTCMDTRLPEVPVSVVSPGIAPSPWTAIRAANDALGGIFDDCLPSTNMTVGQVRGRAASCQSLVRPETGFDVVTLLAVLPPTGPIAQIIELADSMAAVPSADIGSLPNYGINWWTVVVTSDRATIVYHGSVARCGDSMSSGGGFAHC